MSESEEKNNEGNEGGKTKKAIADFLAQKKSSDTSKSVKNDFSNSNKKTNTKVSNNNFKRNKI